MQFLELAETRQSTRSYSDEPVDRELIENCLRAAALAPSACNSQPWKFVPADQQGPLDELRAAASGQGMNRFVKNVPVIIAAVLEPANAASAAGGRIKGTPFPYIDMGAAVEHFCLQAAEIGLGTCILGWFSQQKVRKALQIPKRKKIPLLIAAGYPLHGDVRTKKRKPFASVCSWNGYS